MSFNEQEKLFHAWRDLGNRISSLGGVFQNDFLRMFEEGHVTSKQVQSSLQELPKDIEKLKKDIDGLEKTSIALLNNTAETLKEKELW